MDRVEVLAKYYPLEDLLEQNDVETHVVVQWLVDEGHIDLNDYFFDDEVILDDS